MSSWKDEADFMRDIENISCFFKSGSHNESKKKFVFKSKNKNNVINTPWYESDSENEAEFYSFGRGRSATNNNSNPGENTHLDRMKEIQMQVRSVVGNRYNNEVIESFYNVYKDEEKPTEAPSKAPKEVSISFAKEQKNMPDVGEKKSDSSSLQVVENSTHSDYLPGSSSTPSYKSNEELKHEIVEKKSIHKKRRPRYNKSKFKNNTYSEEFPPL